MANQTKKYNKFIVSSVAATLVGSAIAPVAGFAAQAEFSDVKGHWAKEAIDYLVGKEAINGYEDGTFRPDGQITRAEAAKLLAATLDLEIDENAKTNFDDAKDHWASAAIAAIQAEKPGVINGYEDGTFQPEKKITRQEMAKMIATAYDLEQDESVEVDFTDNNGWGAEFVEVLASLGVVQGMSEGVFAPTKEVTRAETATFISRVEVPDTRGIVPPYDGTLTITAVNALTEDGHVLEVAFNKAMDSVDRTDVSVFESASKSRIGVEKVELAKDGKTAVVTLYDNVNANAEPEIAPLTNYTIQIDALTFEFQRPEYVGDAIVSKLNTDDNEIVIAFGGSKTKTLEVPEGLDFDFEEALGQDIRVWYNAKDQVVDFIFETDSVQYDAVELDHSKSEIKLVQADQTLDLFADYQVFLNGKTVAESISDDVNYDYAKVITNDDGDVVRVYAYNWEASVIVERVESDFVYGHDENLNLEDFVIVKDGKQITTDEIQAGDILYYNDDTSNGLGEKGYAEVFTRTVTGVIDDIYETRFEVNGDLYEYGAAESLDSDGDLEDFRVDEAEAMEAAGEEVTLHLDRNGDVVFVEGTKGDVTTTTSAALFVKDILAYEAKGKQTMELNFIDSEGNESTEEIALEDLQTITINGEKLDINNDDPAADEYYIEFNTGDVGGAVNNATQILLTAGDKTAGQLADQSTFNVQLDKDNAAFEVVHDENGNIVGLEFFESDQLDEDISDDDKYVNTVSNGYKKLTDDTLVFDVSEEDPEDIIITKYGEVNFDIYNDGTVEEVYFDGSDAKYVVYSSAEVAEDETYNAVVVDSNKKDGNYARLDAIVNGEEESYSVDADSFTGTLNDGDVIEITVDTGKNEVFDIDDTPDFELIATVVSTDISDDEVTAELANGEQETFRLVADGMVVDATDPSDITVEEVRDLEAGDPILVIRDAEGTSYVNTIVKTAIEEK